MTMNATRTTLRQALPRWQRGIVRAVLLMGALASMTLVSTAHAQIAFRSSSSAFTSAGGPMTPTLRAAASGGPPITIVGESRMPASDDAITTATSASITPPSGMQANDVVLAIVAANVPSATSILNSAAAGQTWTSMVLQSGSNPTQKVFSANFTGTWSGNPAFSWGATAATYQIWMVVLRGVDTSSAWTNIQDYNCCAGASYDARATFAAPASPFDVTIPASSFTTSTDNALVFGTWHSADDNTWALQTPGWSSLGGQPQWRTMAAAGGAGADSSSSIAYLTQATAGPVPALTNRQASLGGDAGYYRIFAMRPAGMRKPPGTVAGDVMIASIAFGLDTPTITPPAGWTLIRRITSSSGSFYSMAIFWRAADASDAGVSSYTFTISNAANGWVGGIQSFSGVDTTNPIVVENGQITASALTHATPSGLTTGAVANTLLVATHMAFNGSITGWTPPVGMTETLDLRTGIGGVVTMETSNVVQAAPGTIPIKTATISGATGYAGAAHILALRGRAWTGTATTISATFASNVVAGNLIAVYVTYDGTGTLNSVTDSLGNTYTIVQTLS